MFISIFYVDTFLILQALGCLIYIAIVISTKQLMHFGVNCVKWKEGNKQLKKEKDQALQRFKSPFKA